MATEDPADSYFAEIEAHFAFRRGTPFVFSGKDWALMKSWHESGVPLAIVLEAIDNAFDARERSGRKSPISSLSYCRHSVTDLWEERRQQLVGGEGSVPEIDPAERVRDLADAIDSLAQSGPGSTADVFRRTAGELRGLAAKSRSAPTVEGKLIEIETEMIDALLEAIPPETRADLLATIDAELDRYEIADEETRLKTRDANVRRLLRKEFAIPRLSLFG